MADVLGIDGLRIEFGEPDTTPTSMPNLGTPTSMQDLARWLPFTPMQPAALGAPDAVYLRILENGDTLGILAWKPSESLPRTAETNLGALLIQFAPPEDAGMMLKTVGLSTGTVTDTFVDWQSRVLGRRRLRADDLREPVDRNPPIRQCTHLASGRHRLPARIGAHDGRSHRHRGVDGTYAQSLVGRGHCATPFEGLA